VQDIKDNSKNSYKFELDGIRATAIIAVLINHLNDNLLPGGYLGVDVFFTLSGFVISYSINNKAYKNKIEFIDNFYKRRFKRLAPSLIIYVISISFLISFFVHSGGTYYLTAISSLFGLSNLFLLKINSGYWGDGSYMNPFTNTWSLSIEEQFYLLFPLLTTFLISKRGNFLKFNIKYIYLITIFSFSLYLILYRDFGEISYYLTLTRIWQISLGIICFLIYKKNILENILNSKFNLYLSIISFIFLISSFFIPQDYSFLGHISASISTFTLILSLKKHSYINDFMSNSLFKLLSKLSYQIYLWHWGLIVIFRWTYGINIISVFFIIFLTFIISLLMNIYIENPIRKSNFNLSNKYNLIILIFVSLIPFALARPLKTKFFLGELSGKEKLSNPTENGLIIVHGDSHAEDLYKIFKNNNSKLRIKRNIITGCKYYDLNYLKRCKSQENVNEKLFKYSQESKNIIILASNLNPYLSGNLNPLVHDFDFGDRNYDQFEITKVKKFIISILENNKAKIIFKLPHTTVTPPDMAKPIRCIKRSFRPKLNGNCYVTPTKRINFNGEYANLKNEFMEIKEKYSNFYLWDLSSVLCPSEMCYPTKGNQQFLHDESHIFYTSPNLNKKIITSFEEVIKEINIKRKL